MAKGLHIKIDQIEILIEGNMFDHDCFVSKILVFVPCIFDLSSVSFGFNRYFCRISIMVSKFN